MARAVLLRRLLAGLGLAGPLLAGCAGYGPKASPPELPARVAAEKEPSALQRVSHHSATKETSAIQNASDLIVSPANALKPPSAHSAKEVPITLDTVLRIAEQSNARIALAREKLHESQLDSEHNCRSWMPDVYAGIAYYRHEGGIQNEDGRVTNSSTGAIFPGVQVKTEWDVRERAFREVDAERKVWQQKAELSQVNNEVLLEAATTYVDLLTARRGEALVRELQKYEHKVLQQAERIAKVEASADALVAGMKSSIAHRDYQMAQLRQQGNSASAKLVYLLGLPPLTALVPADPVFAPFELVDSTPRVEVLVDRALATGPGVQELTGLLNTIQNGLDRSYDRRNLLPTVEVSLWEGYLAGGPGMTFSGDNRFDATIQLKWNLTALLKAEEKRQVVRSKIEQTRWTLQDVQNRLAAGVQEAKNTIESGREQIGHAVSSIQNAAESYRLSDARVEKGVKGATPVEVVTSIQALERAHFEFLQATREHNKAQVRLLLLVGCPPANEKKVGPPVQLPEPTPVKGKRQAPPREKNDQPEKLDPPKDDTAKGWKLPRLVPTKLPEPKPIRVTPIETPPR